MTTSTLSRSEYNNAYYKANREKLKAMSKAYREANLEIINARKKAYREANREKLALHFKIYHEANPSKVIINNLALKYKISRSIARALISQELIEVKILQIQLRRLINARA